MMMMIQFAIVVKNDRTPKQNIVVLFYSVVLRPLSKTFTCRICVIEIVTFENHSRISALFEIITTLISC